MTGCPSRSSCPPAARGRPGAELADSLSMAFLVLLEALSPVERAVLGRRRQGAGDREAAGPAVARHAAARRPAPPGPGPWRLDLAGLGRRPAERRVVRRQRARGQRGRARRGRRRGQAIRAVLNPGKLGHIGPVSDVARLPPAQNAQFRAPKYGHPANGDPVQNGGYRVLCSGARRSPWHMGRVQLPRLRPPSTTMRWPVMNPASSEARKLTAWAMSPGVPIRPAGTEAR